MSRRSEGIDPRERGGDMSDAVGWLVGIGCAVGLLVSSGTVLQTDLDDFIMETPLIVTQRLLFLVGPLGYLLVGWICVQHWKTVNHREVALMCAVAFGGTLVFLFSWRGPPPPGVQLVLCVGFWMLNGLALAWLLRKLRRIMREANAEE